jgi:hypothetical protein
VVLTVIDGILFKDDHKSLPTALETERDAWSKAEKAFKSFEGVDLVQVNDLWNSHDHELAGRHRS